MLLFLFLLHHYYIIITSFFMLFYVFRAFECVFKNTKNRKKKSVNDHAFVEHKCARRASRLTRASKLNEKGGMTACMTIFPKKRKIGMEQSPFRRGAGGGKYIASNVYCLTTARAACSTRQRTIRRANNSPNYLLFRLTPSQGSIPSIKKSNPKMDWIFWCRWWESNPHGITTTGF